jgi:hypothetical protein
MVSCPCSSYLLVNQLMDFHEILYGHDTTGGNLASTLFNSLSSMTPTWQPGELLMWQQHLCYLQDAMLCGNKSSKYMEPLLR